MTDRERIRQLERRVQMLRDGLERYVPGWHECASCGRVYRDDEAAPDGEDCVECYDDRCEVEEYGRRHGATAAGVEYGTLG